MSQPDWHRVEEIFNAASELTHDARPAFLDEACAGNPDLRRQVELLLSNDRQADSFLEEPVFADSTVTMAATMQPGRQLGPYRIVSPRGAGGMGEVYRAHDTKLGRSREIRTGWRASGAKPGLWPGSIIPTSARSMALKNRVPSIAWSWNWSKEKHSAVR